MTTIDINSTSLYPVLLGNGILSGLGGLIREKSRAVRALIVSDSNVAPLYLETAMLSLQAEGFQTASFVFAAGERNKTLKTVEEILKTATQNDLDRKDIVIALGGGVTGDMAGFAAAVYLRGIKYVQVPTSLLAQIDSSVGGKTGCDLAAGKNLVGAFHSPLFVLCDFNCLETLPSDNFADGMSEMIKTAAIKDRALFDELGRDFSRESLYGYIERCIDIKRVVVEADEFEAGERRLLNFGHTIGHAIERCQNYSGYGHGQAVAIGMAMITKASQDAGLTQTGTYEMLSALLCRHGLPTECDIPVSELCRAALSDKKREALQISLALLSRVGEAYVYTIDTAKLEGFLS